MNLAQRERQHNTDALLNVESAASLLGISPATVYRMARANQIPFVSLRGSIRFRVEALVRWLEEIEGQRVSA
jgi:excisionase family DNA binding protein